MTGFSAFNRLYASLPPSKPSEAIELVFDRMNITFPLEGHFDDLPAKGPVVIVANHPFGMVDGLGLHMLMKRVRPDDSRVMVISWLGAVPEIQQYTILVAPRVTNRRARSVTGLRQAYDWLHKGGMLAVFPASHVERFRWDKGRIAELDWTPHIAKLIRRTGATTVPVFFRGHNSLSFRLLTAIFPPIITASLIHEFLNKRNKRIVSVWGEPIPPETWTESMSDAEVIADLQRTVENLGRTRAPAGASE